MYNKNQNYKTKQRALILEYIEKNKAREITASEILKHLNKKENVSQTTIYRYLNKLVEDGKIKKAYSEEKSSACFQYVSSNCNMHYHLKCEKCGEIIHIDNELFSKLEENIKTKYDFKIDNIKTILLGVCKRCQNN